jgi:molybdopterin converting factor small subunit
VWRPRRSSTPSNGIHVEVRFHAELTRFAPGGQAQVHAALPSGARVQDLLARYPPLDQRRLVVGLNGELAKGDAELHDGDRVDLLTAMAGG